MCCIFQQENKILKELNKPGNTVIAGHNYRNSRFFSNNKKLNIGDKIYVTDYRWKENDIYNL